MTAWTCPCGATGNSEPAAARDAKHVGDTRPDVSMHMRTRTDFEAVCKALRVKATERRWSPHGQRQWWAPADARATA